MQARDIREFRSMVRIGLENAGFIPKRLGPKMPLAWALPAEEVSPIFFPHEIRRPWGFNLSGTLAIELTPLTNWLQERSTPTERGLFRYFFVNYHMANDDLLNGFQVGHGEDAPVDEWINSVKVRLSELPTTIDSLLRTYRRAPDHLGWFAAPLNKAAWDFLSHWQADRHADLPIPQRPF